MTIYTCTRGDLVQRLVVVDLDSEDGVKRAIGLLPPVVRAVYTDPPWTPGIATAFRTKSGLDPCVSFADLMRRCSAVYQACVGRGAADIFVEHSVDPEHHGVFIQASAEFAFGGWPRRTVQTVYGSPKRSAVLFHFGYRPPSEDLSGLSGPRLVQAALRGAKIAEGGWVVDPCIGQGMTSRACHSLGVHCFGTELDPKRLAKTVDWLAKKGYRIEESTCGS